MGRGNPAFATLARDQVDAPVATLIRQPLVMVVHPSLRWPSRLVATAAENRLTVCSTG
jgi:hypothetical protein